MKKLIIPVILLIMLAVGVNALSAAGGNIYVREKGNTGLGATADPLTSYTAYSINYPSSLVNYTNTSYAICNIGASDVNPVVVDFNKDGYGDIFTVIDKTAYLYNRDCELMTSFTIPIGVDVFSPALDNPDEDSKINLYLGNYSNLQNYEYNEDSGQFDYISTSNQMLVSVSGYVCPFLSGFCVGDSFSVGGNYNLAKISTETMTYQSYHSAPYLNGATLATLKRNSLHTFRGTMAGGGYYYRVPSLFVHDTNNDLYLTLWDPSGLSDLVTAESIQALGGTTATLVYRDSFIAQLGSTTYTFAAYDVTASYDYVGNKIFDTTSLSTLYSFGNFTIAGKGINTQSNWVVGDFDHNGNNEACYMRLRGYSPAYANFTNTEFVCLQSALGTEQIINIAGVMSVNHFAMADFDANNSYSEIVTCEGIFRYDGAAFTKIFSTGITGNCTGDVEVFRDGSSGLMTALYTSNITGFFIRSTAVGANCGDGVCGLYENAYNCLEDCNITTTTTTGTTYENGTAPVGTFVGLGNTVPCSSGYVEYGKCALKPGGVGCTLNSECLSNECVNNLCNSPGAWAGINQFVEGSFGNDTTSLTFISIFIILVLSGGIIFMSQGSLAGIVASIGTMVMLMIFFTIVGWLPFFFIVGLVLLVLVTIGFLLVIKG